MLLHISDEGRVAGYQGFEASSAMTYSLKNKKLEQLLIPGQDNIYVAQEGLGNIIGISPDGKWVYMPAYSGDAVYSGGKQLVPPLALFKSRLKGGRVLLHKRGVANTIDYFVDDQGKVIATESYDADENLHKVFAYPKKAAKEIYSIQTPYITKSFIGVSFDEESLVMRDYDANGRIAIFHIALTDGTITGPLYNKPNADISRVITDPQRKVIGVEYSGFHPSYQFFDDDLNTRVQAMLAEFPAHSVFITEISPNREHILVKVEGTQVAGDYFLFSKGQNLKYIAASRPNIPADHIHPIGTVSFKARDGLKIPTIITIPRTSVSNMKNLPAVVMPHGGPATYDAIEFNYTAQALAEQGYLVIQPQFRGSSGFGVDHLAAGYGEWGGKMQDDITDAVSFFADKGIVDKEHVCIVGASYGGYAALAGGAFTPDLYRCVVSENGVGNLEDFMTWVGEERGRSSASAEYWHAQIQGFGDQDTNKFTSRSPELYAESFTAPVLLIYSEKDTTVPPRQSVTMYNALKEAGKSVERIKLKGDDHYLFNNTTRMEALRATIDFVNKHI